MAVLVVLSTACSPHAPSPAPRPSADLAISAVTPVAGNTGAHTPLEIHGTGFQPGASVTLGGVAAAATVAEATTIRTTARPHPAGEIDIVVTNPGGQSYRLERGFTYADDLAPPGDLTIRTGESIRATLQRGDPTCALESIPCRRLFVDAPAGDTIEVELVPADARRNVGLAAQSFVAPTVFPKQLTVKAGQQVWVMGDYGVFTLTARLRNAATNLVSWSIGDERAISKLRHGVVVLR